MKHTKYICTKDHDDGGFSCMFCAGGLFACTICGGFEGTLTTECPGTKLTPEQEVRIYEKGNLDFRGGQWVEEPNYPRSEKP